MNRVSNAFATFVLCTVLGACGGGGGSDGEGAGGCGALGARIFDGETCSQSARSPVVALFPIVDTGNQLRIAGICTGVLVTLDDFVTSAHCFADPVRQFGDQIAGFGVVVGGESGEALAVSNLKLHPSYDGEAGSPFDIAIATLNRVPSPPIGPVPLLQSVRTSSGDDATTFGYGTSNKGQIGILKSADVSIGEVIGGNILVADADGSGSICQGDSGGPLVRTVDGVTSLIGINSFGLQTADECAESGNILSGFVDLQESGIAQFLTGYAADIAVR